MKTRAGFVSNSSTSSFVLFTTKKNYERALLKADSLAQRVAKALAGFPKDKFLNEEMVVFHTYSDNGGEGTWSYLEIEGDYSEHDDFYGAFEEFVTILKEMPSEVMEHNAGG